jgi:hypothetical protein
MQVIAGEQSSLSVGATLVKQLHLWCPSEYCRIAIETLAYSTDLRLWKVCAVASAALRGEFRDSRMFEDRRL